MSNESNISDEMNSIGYFYYLLYIYKNTYLHSFHKKPLLMIVISKSNFYQQLQSPVYIQSRHCKFLKKN